MLEFYILSVLSLVTTWTFAQQPEKASLIKCQANVNLTSDPCALAMSVSRVCNPKYTVTPAQHGYHYNGVPSGDSDNQCLCSTVYYSLLSVCALCQGADMAPWSLYSINCTNTYEGWPKNLSSGILTVPHWAFTPLRNIGTVNLQAIAVDNQPDVMLSGLASTSGTVSENPTQTSSQTSSQTSPESSLSNTPKHGPDPVIISGGAVGGAVFVLLTTSFVFWRHRRKSRRDAVQSGEGGSRSRSTSTEPFLLSAPIDPLRSSKGSVQRDANQTSQTAAEWQESWRVSPTKGLKILTVDPCSDHSGPSQEQSSSIQEQSTDESRNESRTDTLEPTVIDRPQIVTAQDPENPRTRVESNEETDTELAFSESQYRAMQARMDRLVAEIDEISRFVPPPAYHG